MFTVPHIQLVGNRQLWDLNLLWPLPQQTWPWSRSAAFCQQSTKKLGLYLALSMHRVSFTLRFKAQGFFFTALQGTGFLLHCASRHRIYYTLRFKAQYSIGAACLKQGQGHPPWATRLVHAVSHVSLLSLHIYICTTLRCFLYIYICTTLLLFASFNIEGQKTLSQAYQRTPSRELRSHNGQDPRR